MLPKLWTVGASARALANSCRRGGFTIAAADQFNDVDLQLLGPTQQVRNYPHDLLTLAREIQCDAWLYTGGLENYPELIDAIASSLPLLGNRGTVLREVRDVTKLQSVLYEHGFHLPAMRAQLGNEDISQWLIKSSRSSGGLRVRRAHDTPLKDDEYYQQLLAGELYGAVFIATDKTAYLLGISHHLRASWLNAPEFQYAGSLGPVMFEPGVMADIQRLGVVLAQSFGLSGWFGVDFIVDANQHPWILEVNPRYTASVEVLERAAGVSSAPLHVQACANALLDVSKIAPFAAKKKIVGKAVLYAEKEMLVRAELSSQWLRAKQLADIPVADTNIMPGEPILTMFATGDSESEVLLALEQQSASICS